MNMGILVGGTGNTQHMSKDTMKDTDLITVTYPSEPGLSYDIELSEYFNTQKLKLLRPVM